MESEMEKREETTQGCTVELVTTLGTGPVGPGRSPGKWVSGD